MHQPLILYSSRYHGITTVYECTKSTQAIILSCRGIYRLSEGGFGPVFSLVEINNTLREVNSQLQLQDYISTKLKLMPLNTTVLQ